MRHPHMGRNAFLLLYESLRLAFSVFFIQKMPKNFLQEMNSKVKKHSKVKKFLNVLRTYCLLNDSCAVNIIPLWLSETLKEAFENVSLFAENYFQINAPKQCEIGSVATRFCLFVYDVSLLLCCQRCHLAWKTSRGAPFYCALRYSRLR